ncbi:MAG: hypothetical protein IPK39_08525 [Sulfuritalea sp.]|nr:hypothetical protein [Sulfuritalea sp.]
MNSSRRRWTETADHSEIAALEAGQHDRRFGHGSHLDFAAKKRLKRRLAR